MKGCAPPIKVQEMAPLLPKVEEVTIMPFPLRRVMANPPMERRICISSPLKRKVEVL